MTAVAAPAPSFVSGASAAPLLYRTVDAVLKTALASGPDRLALVVAHQSVRYSYRDLDAAVERVARGLIGCGLKPVSYTHLTLPTNREV